MSTRPCIRAVECASPTRMASCSQMLTPLLPLLGQGAYAPIAACRYAALLACIQQMDMDELIMAIRRRSQGFTRGSSSYRGVTQHKSGGYRRPLVERLGRPLTACVCRCCLPFASACKTPLGIACSALHLLH